MQKLVIRCSNVQDVLRVQSIDFSAFAKIVFKYLSLHYPFRNNDPRNQNALAAAAAFIEGFQSSG